ncbi:DUF1080 domain-containing protein [Pelagicoccus sp. SDUM812003]|uniref:3-keto-disaccharide hydrolase n=1 Tax=Pelagicoccus sp. SDUM812003 TaxID=3041267 RepID=UPI00280ECFCC|nr:DUF1080 domain-containing protein [Pelagicoccus sp. SDUM812003]MDQ8204777.1 DUF1080 domain-containing protein [Pelagicoccus sp. SDUM812003]
MRVFTTFLAAVHLLVLAPSEELAWKPLFDGKSLHGWTVKVAKHPLGENFANTFRVEDGILKVSYDDYQSFDMQVAHLYSDLSYSHYRLRLKYKFVEDFRADAPPWTKRNSGVMLHSQSPLSMELDQAFPVSIEAQFLAEETEAGRQTGNAATPGTHISINGQQTTDHIIDSSSALHPINTWIQVEVLVRGHEELVYFINGEEVLRFHSPVLDPEDPDAKRLLDAGASPAIGFGHIALQAEGQAIWFRDIEIMPLAKP